MKLKGKDNAKYPIIAIDFDNTINVGGDFPACGEVRPYAKEVINFMHNLGIKIVIWTSRDMAYNQEEKKIYDHITPMIEWLDGHDIHYDAINKSIQFAPYYYNGRKIYAHMYVDDRGFGWDESHDIMLDVLKEFLVKVCDVPEYYAGIAIHDCADGKRPDAMLIEFVKQWEGIGYDK